MKIINLEIHRYKSIEHIEMNEIDNLNVLVGENGSGKTNVLELLLLFFREFSRIGRTTSQLTPEHWYKREQSEPIAIRIVLEFSLEELERIFGSSLTHYVNSYLEEQNGHISIHTTLSSTGQWSESKILLDELPLHENGTQMELHELLGKLGYVINLPIFYAQPSTEDDRQWASEDGVPYSFDDEQKEVHRINLNLLPYFESDLITKMEFPIDEWIQKQGYVNSSPLTLNDFKIQNVNQNLDALGEIVRESLIVVETIHQQFLSPVRSESIPPNEIKEIISFYDNPDGQKQGIWFKFKKDFERVFGGSLIRVDNEIQYELNQRRYSLTSIGGGHANWFRVLWQISQNKDKIILLEEPESHMHSRLAKSVGVFLHEASKNNQIFFTTHSTVFLDQCSYDEIWLVRYLEDTGTKVQRIENFESLKDIALILGITPSDILYSNNILFVEGSSDMTYLQAAAKLMDIKLFPTRVGVLVFEGIGKGRFHLSVFREAVAAAKTPFFVLLDGDKDAKKKGDELLEKKLVTKDQLLNLKMRDIENYYPKDLFFEALNALYQFTEDEISEIQKAIESGTCTKQIDKVLHQMREVQNGVWKNPVAEYLSAHMKLEHVDSEIRNVILQIDRFFLRNREEGVNFRTNN